MALLMPDKTDFKSQVDMRHKERHLYKGSLHNKDTITNTYTLTLGLLRKWSTLTEFREKKKNRKLYSNSTKHQYSNFQWCIEQSESQWEHRGFEQSYRPIGLSRYKQNSPLNNTHFSKVNKEHSPW